MDEQLGDPRGRVRARGRPAPAAIVVAGDHGEGLGEHGESRHGDLLYQATMHVPLLLVGPGVAPGVVDTPVSTRRVFHTILDLAGLGRRGQPAPTRRPEVVLGEAMKPFLEYGWQPQVMAVEGRDQGDPGRTDRGLRRRRRSRRGARPRRVGGAVAARCATRCASIPMPAPAAAGAPDDPRRRGAAEAGQPRLRRRAARRPSSARTRRVRPTWRALFDVARARLGPLRARGVRARDPAARADPARGSLQPRCRRSAWPRRTRRWGTPRRRSRRSRRRRRSRPDRRTSATYLALHYARGKDWPRGGAAARAGRSRSRRSACPPWRRWRAFASGRGGPARRRSSWQQDLRAARARPRRSSLRLGRAGHERGADRRSPSRPSRRRGRAQGAAFTHDLELGVLYLDARRLAEARDALDRVPPSHPAYAMALFKRAQVSVLLHEPDQAARIEAARRHADADHAAADRAGAAVPAGR